MSASFSRESGKRVGEVGAIHDWKGRIAPRAPNYSPLEGQPRLMKEGLRLMKEGLRLMKEGLRLMKEGLRLMKEGLRLMKEGLRLMKEGLRFATEGRVLVRLREIKRF